MENKKFFLLKDIKTAINENYYLLLILKIRDLKKFFIIIPQNLGSKLEYYAREDIYNNNMVYKLKPHCSVDTWSIGTRKEIIEELNEELILVDKSLINPE